MGKGNQKMQIDGVEVLYLSSDDSGRGGALATTRVALVAYSGPGFEHREIWIPGTVSSINAVEFCDAFLSIGDDGSVGLWDFESGERLRGTQTDIEGLSYAAAASDGSSVAFWSPGRLHVWRLEDDRWSTCVAEGLVSPVGVCFDSKAEQLHAIYYRLGPGDDQLGPGQAEQLANAWVFECDALSWEIGSERAPSRQNWGSTDSAGARAWTLEGGRLVQTRAPFHGAAARWLTDSAGARVVSVGPCVTKVADPTWEDLGRPAWKIVGTPLENRFDNRCLRRLTLDAGSTRLAAVVSHDNPITRERGFDIEVSDLDDHTTRTIESERGSDSRHIARLALSPNGQRLAAVDTDSRLDVFDVATGRCAETLEVSGDTYRYSVRQLEWSGDADHVCVVSEEDKAYVGLRARFFRSSDLALAKELKSLSSWQLVFDPRQSRLVAWEPAAPASLYELFSGSSADDPGL
jgi:WD40 repeat protein